MFVLNGSSVLRASGNSKLDMQPSTTRRKERLKWFNSGSQHEYGCIDRARLFDFDRVKVRIHLSSGSLI
jgi:hypothetical protein